MSYFLDESSTLYTFFKWSAYDILRIHLIYLFLCFHESACNHQTHFSASSPTWLLVGKELWTPLDNSYISQLMTFVSPLLSNSLNTFQESETLIAKEYLKSLPLKPSKSGNFTSWDSTFLKKFNESTVDQCLCRDFQFVAPLGKHNSSSVWGAW